MNDWKNYGRWRHPEYFQKVALENQKKIAAVFTELLETEKNLESDVVAKGWIHRNALISHVYSNYEKDQELLARKKDWEDAMIFRNILSGLIKIIRPYRDLYGYFPNYEQMIAELDDLYNAAINREEYEIAKVIHLWLTKIK